jgi:ribonuclease HI
MPDFTCQSCSRSFSVPAATLAKYPGWAPKQCLDCKNKKPATSTRSPSRTVSEVLDRFSDGPTSGVFTDGAASPNPGPGGWGAVYVVDGAIVAERRGHEPQTTNNRMELSALIAGFELVPRGVPTIVYTDSELCVNTITKWAASWERNGWKKKNGEIKNLELVQRLFALARARPEIELRWIKAHAGSRWNEYADALASAYRREAV